MRVGGWRCDCLGAIVRTGISRPLVPAAGMALFNRPRLSVQPVSKRHWDFILALEEKQPPQAAPRPRKKNKVE